MTPLMIAALGLLMVATAFLSGLFGMAGGLILIGVLLTILPLPSAMVLHAITQMASNGSFGSQPTWQTVSCPPPTSSVRLKMRAKSGLARPRTCGKTSGCPRPQRHSSMSSPKRSISSSWMSCSSSVLSALAMRL